MMARWRRHGGWEEAAVAEGKGVATPGRGTSDRREEGKCQEVRGVAGAGDVTDRGGRLSGRQVSGEREAVRVSGKRSARRGG
jgi:hypothetical protein